MVEMTSDTGPRGSWRTPRRLVVSPTTMLLLLLLHAQLGLEAAVKHRRYYNYNYSDNDNSSSRRTTTTTPGVASAGAFVFRDCGAYILRD